MFDADEFEIMWQASSFESNFARAMIVNWVKLAFLAMLGVVASTFLSFPVAMLLAFTVFAGGSMTRSSRRASSSSGSTRTPSS